MMNSHHHHDANEGWEHGMFFFSKKNFFQLLLSLLNVYLQQAYHNGKEWPLLSPSVEWTQAWDTDVSWFQYVKFFFCLFFFFSHHLIIIYSQTTCMEWQPGQPQQMTTLSRMMNRGLETQMMCFKSPVCFFFLSFFLFYWLTFIIWLHCKDNHTPPPPPQQTGLETQMHLVPQVYIFTFDTRG